MREYSSCSLEQLVELCKENRAAAAWEEFVCRTQRVIAATIWSTLRRWGASESVVVEDLVQETYLKISANQAANLRRFQSRHPQAILGYIRATAVNIAHDHCKGMIAAKRGAGQKLREVEDIDAVSGPNIPGGVASIERNILLGQIDQILLDSGAEEAASRDRAIFWLYYRQGLTAAAIAASPDIGLTVKGVESVILRLNHFVRTKLANSGTLSISSKKDLSSTKSL